MVPRFARDLLLELGRSEQALAIFEEVAVEGMGMNTT